MKMSKKLFAMITMIVVILALISISFVYYEKFVNTREIEKNAPPFSTLLEINGEVNFEATIENGPANEVTIAVNPNDPKNLIAGGKDYTLGPEGNGYKVWSGYYWSKDGGITWGNGLLGYPDIDNSILGVYDAISDPVVAFDGQGNAYYSGLAYKSSSEPVLEFPRPWIANNGIFVAKSTDGGETYSQITFVAQSPTGTIFNDKQWFTIDPENGYIYFTWTMFQGVQARVVFSRSTDEGLNWDPPRDISRWFEIPRQTQGSMPVVGLDGTIYVSWIDYSEMSLMLSVSNDNGQSWPIFAEPIKGVDPPPTYVGDNEYRTPTISSMAIDRSQANTSGNLYIVWHDNRNGNPDILLIRSEDGGSSWSEPQRLNDDSENGTAEQFFPWIDVSPEGDVHVVFYDKREDPGNYFLDLYYTHSKDGKNFDKNWKITSNSSDPSHSYHQSGSVFIGDYIGIDSSENYAYAFWADTRKGVADAFCAVIVGQVDNNDYD
jgi:hypothetical protein